MDFKISIEQTGEVERSINIEIPRALYNERFELAIRKAAQQARIKGFRPGRAPKAIIDKLYGQQIHSDVLGELVSKAYHDAVEEHALKVVGYPTIDIDGSKEVEEDFRITAGISVFPEPEIKDYFGLKFEVEAEPFSEEEQVEKQIEQLKNAYASLEPVEGRDTTEQGDLAMVDFEGKIDGEPFDGSQASDTYLELGSESYPKQLEDGVVGMKIGEEKEIEVTLSADDNQELAGKTAQYLVKLKGIYRKELPELDDELAKKSGLGETAEEMKTKLAKLLTKDHERRVRNLKEEQYFKTLLEKNSFEVPQAMCDEEIRNFLFEMGLLDPSREESRRFDVSAFRETMGEAAEFRVRQAVALSRIMEQEKMSAEPEDVEAWLDQRAEEEERPREEINRIYGFPAQTSRLQSMVARERMLDRLLEESKIKMVEKKPETAEKSKKSGGKKKK